MLSTEDYKKLYQLGISEEAINDQIDRFVNGIKPLKLKQPAVLNDGIQQIAFAELESFSKIYDESDVPVIKFVPASGAATRMFKVLFQFLESKKANKTEPIIDEFYQNLKDFAFFEDVELGYDQELTRENLYDMIRFLLHSDGLGLGNKPKGLLKFHRYTSTTKTPLEEHIDEGLAYATKSGITRVHFTVSPEHQKDFEEQAKAIIESKPSKYEIEISFSTQRPSTDTIAVDLENRPYRLDDGSILLRPAGHGALLENLNELDSDIVFIKNIDNVVKEEFREDTILYKRALAGILLQYQKQVFDLLRRSDQGENVFSEARQLLVDMGWKGNYSDEETIQLLNRPIRVCGMVKNQGDPGGGPFWVEMSDGLISLQIVESSQVKKKIEEQRKLFESGTHFNPVDLVCGLKNYTGEKFDLLKFRDRNAGFITGKTHLGNKIKALELPGLWNGGMAYWNTIFVEVPQSTFSPVKTVMDLLKKEHR